MSSSSLLRHSSANLVLAGNMGCHWHPPSQPCQQPCHGWGGIINGLILHMGSSSIIQSILVRLHSFTTIAPLMLYPMIYHATKHGRPLYSGCPITWTMLAISSWMRWLESSITRKPVAQPVTLVFHAVTINASDPMP